MMSKSLERKKFRKFLCKGWYKNKYSLYFSSSESENKPGMQIRYWVLWWMNGKGMWNSFKICWLIGKRTFSPWIEKSEPWEKEKRFQKFVILWLRLLENHTLLVISLFVEKKLPLEYLFPSERSCWTKSKKKWFSWELHFLFYGKPL